MLPKNPRVRECHVQLASRIKFGPGDEPVDLMDDSLA